PFSEMDFRTDGRDHKIVDAFSVRRSRPTVFRNGFPHGWSPSQNCGRVLRTEKPANHFQKWISARMVAITKLWTRSPYGEAGQPFSEMDFRTDGHHHKIVDSLSLRRSQLTIFRNGFPHGWSRSQNCGRALRTEKPANRFQKWISTRMVTITKLWTRSPYGEAS